MLCLIYTLSTCMYRGNLGLLLITDKNESGRHVSLFLKMLFIFEGGNARKHLQSLPEINRKCFLKKQTFYLSLCGLEFHQCWRFEKGSAVEFCDSPWLSDVIILKSVFFPCFLLLEKNAGFVYRDKGAWLSAIFAGLGKHGWDSGWSALIRIKNTQ